jgi:hypothetical protein
MGCLEVLCLPAVGKRTVCRWENQGKRGFSQGVRWNLSQTHKGPTPAQVHCMMCLARRHPDLVPTVLPAPGCSTQHLLFPGCLPPFNSIIVIACKTGLNYLKVPILLHTSCCSDICGDHGLGCAQLCPPVPDQMHAKACIESFWGRLLSLVPPLCGSQASAGFAVFLSRFPVLLFSSAPWAVTECACWSSDAGVVSLVIM